MNKIFLMGNLTKDPEVRYTPSGTTVCNFGLAVNQKYKSGNEMKEEVLFINIAVWGKSAENCGQYLSKGSKVLIEGKLQIQSWEHEGQKKYKTVVVAHNVQFLSGKQDSPKDESSYHDKELAPNESTDIEPF